MEKNRRRHQLHVVSHDDIGRTASENIALDVDTRRNFLEYQAAVFQYEHSPFSDEQNRAVA